MYPGHWGKVKPDHPAIIMGSGGVETHRELDERSNRLAQLWWDQGLRPGDHVALFMENNIQFFDVVWAAYRSGLYLTTVNRYLTADEAGFIIDDCGARSLVTSHALAKVAAELWPLTPNVERRLMVDGVVDGYESYETAVAAYPAEPLDDEPLGDTMLYSSGTTGRPKGIKRARLELKAADGNPLTTMLFGGLFGFDESTVYLSPAPLYHSAPLGWTGAAMSLGGTAVIMEHFDPLESLALIERHGVTHSQWVPTMFVRLLKLSDDERNRYDLSSQRLVVHAAAPCPVSVKQQMMDWWGPIIHEYYGGTELNGLTYVGPDDWLAHPGTVGKPISGVIHICDEDGKELAAGEPGIVYFEQPALPFEYHNDETKTKSVTHPEHPNWSALGDVGYVDEEGYLFLTDRATFMIISGGVNIYPQEIENVLITHPRIADVAVFGVPNAEMGEEVKAVVQPLDWAEAGDALAAELDELCRRELAHYKCPRSFDFEQELPRLETGKLYKRLLKDRYWSDQAKI